MPEGDTIFRTAHSLRTWIGGRVITAAQSSLPALAISRVVGRTVERVEAKGKNLLISLVGASGEDDLVLHTHMKMSGSWHVYPAGAPWQKPPRQARVVLEANDRIAVCFNAPIVELADASATRHRPSIRGLGPDVLDEPLDLMGIVSRANSTSPDLALGELLLDQRIVAGIGNIYRCEALFLERRHPWTVRSALSDDALAATVQTAARLMHANLGNGRNDAVGREFGLGPNRAWVYGRAGLGCRVCRTPIMARGQGPLARRAYWCPRCQPDRITPLG